MYKGSEKYGAKMFIANIVFLWTTASAINMALTVGIAYLATFLTTGSHIEAWAMMVREFAFALVPILPGLTVGGAILNIIINLAIMVAIVAIWTKRWSDAMQTR